MDTSLLEAEGGQPFSARFGRRVIPRFGMGLAVFLGLVLGAPGVFAQGAAQELQANEVKSEPSGAKATGARSLRLVVRLPASSGAQGLLDIGQVERFIAAEVQLPVSTGQIAEVDAAQGQASLVLDLSASDGNILAEYTNPEGEKVARLVQRPSTLKQTYEVLALLAGNLVRNEASEILAELSRGSASEEAEPGEEGVEAGAKGGNSSVSEREGALELEPSHEPAPLESYPFHLSVAYPVGLHGEGSLSRAYGFEFGLFYSRVGATRGFGLNPFVLRTEGDNSGVQLSGLVTLSGGAMTGVQIAGLMNWTDGELIGAQLSSLVNGADDVSGFQVGGVYNQAAGLTGAQLGGLANISKEMSGAQLGPFNLASGGLGAQLGVLNLNGPFDGAQVGAVNISGDLSGAQLGVVNVGKNVKGLQLGVVNIADEVDGASIGVVSLAKNGRVQPQAYYSTRNRAHLGVAFQVGPLYSMPQVGMELTGQDPYYEFGLALGAKHQIDRFWGAVDVSSNTELTSTDGPLENLYRGRVMAGVEIIPGAFGVFAGAALRTEQFDEYQPEGHFGVTLF